MIVKEIDGSKVLSDEENSIHRYLAFLEKEERNLEGYNLILDLQKVKNLTIEELLDLLPFSLKHKKKNHSFVVVTTEVDIDQVPEEFAVVPTMGEAEDLIQMEEIERDLGF